jgi:hypothetical protein
LPDPHPRRILGTRPNAIEEATVNPITLRDPASARMVGPGPAGRTPAHIAGFTEAKDANRGGSFEGQRKSEEDPMRKLIVLLAASATVAAGLVAGLQASADGRLHATFTSGAVSVTPDLGMVELILTGTATVQGLGPPLRSSG